MLRVAAPVRATWEPLWCQLRTEAPDIARHSLRVRRYAGTLTTQFCSDNPQFVQSVRFAALLHDIGKLNIPREILNKPAILCETEMAIVRQHPMEGLQLLRKHVRHVDVLATIAHHHERWDGSGYPNGIAGSDIPLGARIVAVADAFDAMTSFRPYRPARCIPSALAVLTAGAGSQWDPDVVQAFLALIPRCRHIQATILRHHHRWQLQSGDKKYGVNDRTLGFAATTSGHRHGRSRSVPSRCTAGDPSFGHGTGGVF